MATTPGGTDGSVQARADLEAEVLHLETLPPNDRLDAAGAAASLEERARTMGFVDLMLRARLIQAVAAGRRGQLAASTRVLREINRWAIEHGDTYLLARTHRHLSHVTRLLGEFGISLEHAVRAVELCDESTPAKVRLDHQHVLAIALARSGHWRAANQRFAAMESEAVTLNDPWFQVLMLNNLAYLNFISGRLPQAKEAADRMVATADEHQLTLLAAWVDTYARITLESGEPQRAVTFMETYFVDSSSDIDSVADCYLTLAEAQRETGLVMQAHRTLDRCEEMSRNRDLMEIQTRVLRERAELYAAEGRYQEAFEEHKRFAAATAVLHSIEQDGRAKVAAAVFETAEARRETERFRALSQQDPLTGLRNRRYVDEQLPGLISNCANQGVPICTAVLDLDHFKQINDRFSHEVGDQVLVTVATMLREITDGVGFAARLGGEEFLLVLPRLDRARALRLCRTLREQFRDYPWSDLHPALAGVTASIGIGCSELVAEPDQASLLRAADANLYRAKRAGRDRVLAGVVPLVGGQRKPEEIEINL